MMRVLLAVGLLRDQRKTVAVSSAPPKGARNSFAVWRRASATFALICLCAAVAPAHRDGSHAEYMGGTRPDIPANSSGDIRVTDTVYFVFVSKKAEVKVPYERINLLEYGQKVSRRYISAVILSPLLLTAKKRQHFLTVGFQDNDGQQQAMVFRVDKSDIRLTLVSLEARTGQRVEYQDEEARIAGKG